MPHILTSQSYFDFQFEDMKNLFKRNLLTAFWSEITSRPRATNLLKKSGKNHTANSLEAHQQVGGIRTHTFHTKRDQLSISLNQSLARCECEMDPLVSRGPLITDVGFSCACVHTQKSPGSVPATQLPSVI